MDAAIAETAGEPVALDQKLCLNFEPGEKLYRVDIQYPLSLTPRIPDATMSGVNEDFIPGGKTSGGVPEIAIDQTPSSQFTVYPLH